MTGVASEGCVPLCVCHYVDFVNKNYPNAIVIFDGYESGPSTKDMTHQRRSGQVMSPVINFTGNMALSFSKDKFLSNDTNKQNIINLIGKILQIAGYNEVFSQEDADVDIVMAAIKESHYQMSQSSVKILIY